MKKNIYPLHDLYVNPITTPLNISNGITVISNNIKLDQIDKRYFSELDAKDISDTQLCLEIDEDIICPKEASIAFIISCRLLKRTKVFIRFRLNSTKILIDVRDDYPFVTSPEVTSWIEQDEFSIIGNLYSGLDKFKRINTRAGNAIYFLGQAYRSRGWLESLIFHVCALETLTSAVERETGVTEKFTEKIHNFIGYDKIKLKEIYNIRSELVHGRYNFKSEEENLRLNAIAEEACRKVFYKILLNDYNIEFFKDDESRLRLFNEG